MSVKRREYNTQRHCLPEAAAAGDKGALKEQSEQHNSFTGNPVTNMLQASVAAAVIIARRYYFIHSALDETYTDWVF